MKIGEHDKRIIVLTNLTFVENYGASEARLYQYCNALSETGCEVLLTSASNDKDFPFTKEIYSNIFILGNFSGKRINYITQQFAFRKFYLYLKKVFSISRSGDGKVVYFLYSFTLASVLMSFLYLKLIKKQKLFCEKNELQTGIALNQFIINSPSKFFPTLLLKGVMIISGIIQDFMTLFFDGLIVISSNLLKLYMPFKRKIIIIPILAQNRDLFLRDTCQESYNKQFSVVYTGEVNQKKDGIFSLVRALHMAKIDFCLNLYGNIHYSEKKKLEKLLTKLTISEKVILNSRVEHSEIPSIIYKADLLVLTRPSNLQTRYGFSTKLAEYMLSGVPVLATNVSDNKSVIIDGLTGFLCEPGSVKSISDKIIEIYSTPLILRKKIGETAKRIAKEKFDVGIYKNQLCNFFFEESK